MTPSSARASPQRTARPCSRTISDNGPRLTDEQFARLTIPLNTSKPQGLGLGLVIVRRIAESARGRVLFERLPERGLAITVSLPVCEQNNRT